MIPFTSGGHSSGSLWYRSFGSPFIFNKHFKLLTSTKISSENMKDDVIIFNDVLLEIKKYLTTAYNLCENTPYIYSDYK